MIGIALDRERLDSFLSEPDSRRIDPEIRPEIEKLIAKELGGLCLGEGGLLPARVRPPVEKNGHKPDIEILSE